MTSERPDLVYAPLPKRSPVAPYRAVGEVAIESGRSRETTSRLGSACERVILGQLWTGNIPIDKSVAFEAGDLVRVVQDELASGASGGVDHKALAANYRRLMHYRNLSDGYRPIFEPMAHLMDLVDHHLGLGVWREYNLIPITCGSLTDSVSYVGEHALVAAKEIAGPQLRFGKGFIPNVTIPGKNGVQFDGVLFRKPSWNGTAPAPDNINALIQASDGYVPLSLKVNFRARYASVDSTLTRPIRSHVLHLQNQIGRVATQFDNGKYDPIAFPDSASIVYLRGLLPNKVFNLKLDSNFYHQWLLDLSESADPMNGRDPDGIANIINFMELLDRHVIYLRQRERHQMQTAADENRAFFGDGTGEQDKML